MIVTKPKNNQEVEAMVSTLSASTLDPSKVGENSVAYSVLVSLARYMERLEELKEVDGEAEGENDNDLSKLIEQLKGSGGVEDEPEEGGDDDLYKDLRDSINSLMTSIEGNKINSTEFHASKSENTLKLDQVYLDALKIAHSDLMTQVEENKALQATQDKRGVWGKVITAVLSIIVVATMVLTGNVVGLLVYGALLFMTTVPTGGGTTTMEKTTSGLASLLEKCPNINMSEETAQIIASAIVGLAVILLTAGVALSSSAKTATTTAATTAAVATTATVAATATATTTATAASAAAVAGTAATAAAAVTATTAAIAASATITSSVVAGIKALTTAATAASAAMAALRASSTGIALHQAFNIATCVGMAAGAVNSTATGIGLVNQGRNAEFMRELESTMTLLNYAMGSNTSTQRDDGKQQSSILDSQTAMTESYGTFSAAGEELAKAMAS